MTQCLPEYAESPLKWEKRLKGCAVPQPMSHYFDLGPVTFHGGPRAVGYRDSRMRAWNTIRATAYGGAIGLGAALVKSLAPWSDMQSSSAVAKELIGATLAFALLCGLAAALRNFILRRLMGSESG
jgi:hypothetical protein